MSETYVGKTFDRQDKQEHTSSRFLWLMSGRIVLSNKVNTLASGVTADYPTVIVCHDAWCIIIHTYFLLSSIAPLHLNGKESITILHKKGVGGKTFFRGKDCLKVMIFWPLCTEKCPLVLLYITHIWGRGRGRMGKRGTELRKDLVRQMPSLLPLSSPLLLLMHTKQYYYIRHWIPVDYPSRNWSRNIL